MTDALVLGATGHIGAHVVRALLAEGHRVRAAYRSQRYLCVLEGLAVERVRVDLEEPERALPAALEGCRWVFHAAGYYPGRRERPEEVLRRGVESTRRVLEVIRRAGPERIVFTSSSATIRAVPGRAATEEDPEPWPPSEWRNLYSRVKIAMEQEALRAAREGMPVVVVNPSLCIGEYDAHAFSGRAVLAFAKYRVPWVTDTLFNIVYTGDVGIGHARAAGRGRVGERYLLAGENLPLREFAPIVAEEAGVPAPRWRMPYAMAVVAGAAAEGWAWLTGKPPLFTRQEAARTRTGHPLDGSKAARELGVPRTPAREAVRRAVAWFKEAGVLR
ncbi:MAG: NAD-dependent epimerase/dehydratase family protein [Candidatus Omnitrophica bacterium]|nr:NAD-dependent epimerase/dehydratase family protein [Candidatus Omnitrophota bacterium]